MLNRRLPARSLPDRGNGVRLFLGAQHKISAFVQIASRRHCKRRRKRLRITGIGHARHVRRAVPFRHVRKVSQPRSGRAAAFGVHRVPRLPGDAPRLKPEKRKNYFAGFASFSGAGSSFTVRVSHISSSSALCADSHLSSVSCFS